MTQDSNGQMVEEIVIEMENNNEKGGINRMKKEWNSSNGTDGGTTQSPGNKGTQNSGENSVKRNKAVLRYGRDDEGINE